MIQFAPLTKDHVAELYGDLVYLQKIKLNKHSNSIANIVQVQQFRHNLLRTQSESYLDSKSYLDPNLMYGFV